jgi:DNA-binding NarL/FixJ family response regulator
VNETAILIVDDTAANIRLLQAVLSPEGYRVVAADSGPSALALAEETTFDLVLLDIMMPEMDGFEVCRRMRAMPQLEAVPIVMITSAGNQEKVRALEVGADDFVAKPFDRAELLARVRSLLRMHGYRQTVVQQAKELASWNATLTQRVDSQIEEIERLARLRRFLSPQLADLIVSSGDDASLRSHRREIAVLFCDLRGFTAFAESSEPEEVMAVLGQFHDVLGELIAEFEATVGYFAGDGLMVFFNDPVPCPEPAFRAVCMATQLRASMQPLLGGWKRRGHDLGIGIGITHGYATLGEIGFEGRSEYAAIGNVVTLASRLCDEAVDGQILVSTSAFAAVEARVQAEPLPDMRLKGIARTVAVHNILGVCELREEGDASRPDGLTAREVEILKLVAEGLSSKEIGERLVLSVRTVERHITNVYDKIGAHSRAQATAYAIGHGITRAES